MNTMKIRQGTITRQRGFNILEVLVAITIFAVGMLALAQLQGALTRSSSNSKARTIASNIAEAQIESVRGFGRIATDPMGVIPAYDDIVSGTASIPDRGGTDFAVTWTATEYYFNTGNDMFEDTPPFTPAPPSDFKLLTVNVAWTDADGTANTVTLRDTIYSVTTKLSGRTLEDSGQKKGPQAAYTPGANPDVVSIALGDSKFKESLLPQPDVFRTDEIVETRFDVVTYSQNNGSVFLRREEFSVLSCECELMAAGTDTGRRPTVWDGEQYELGEIADKPYGVSASNSQSPFCDICCRDHHDGGSGGIDVTDGAKALYDPFRAAGDYAADGNHKHYKKLNDGSLNQAVTGDVYLEACRMIRKGGFFRPAQDLRQESFFVFPEDYLDQAPEIDEYSRFVTEATVSYVSDAIATANYHLSPPMFDGPGDVSPPFAPPTSTNLPTFLGSPSQQLRSRGIYVDYLSKNVRDLYSCLLTNTSGGVTDGAACNVPNVSTPLEVLPFFDVNQTFLANWREDPLVGVVDVTNETISTDNTHSRGVVSIQAAPPQQPDVVSEAHTGNLGLTGSDPIDPNFSANERGATITVTVTTALPPPPVGTLTFQGNITSAVGGVQASNVSVTNVNSQCQRTNTGYTCLVAPAAPGAAIRVTGYWKNNKVTVACSDTLGPGVETGISPNLVTEFSIDPAIATPDPAGDNIIIRQNTCAP